LHETPVAEKVLGHVLARVNRTRRFDEIYALGSFNEYLSVDCTLVTTANAFYGMFKVPR
jgi:hypothetical protein